MVRYCVNFNSMITEGARQFVPRVDNPVQKRKEGPELLKPEKETPEVARSKMAVDFLLKNYVNGEGNLLSLSVVAEQNEEKINELVTNEQGDEIEWYEWAKQNEVIQEVENRIKNASTPLEKILLARLIVELINNLAGEEEHGQIEKWSGVIRDMLTNPETPALVIFYVKQLLANADYNFLGNVLKDEQEKPANPLQFHDERLAKLRFNFTDGALDTIYANSPDLKTNTPSPVNFKNTFLVSEEYITSQLTPDIVGIYIQKGDLIGYRKITPEIGKELHTDRKTLQSNLRAPFFDVDEVVDIKDQIPNKITKDDLALFKIMESLPIREKIQREIGIDLSRLSLRIQYQLLKFISEATQSEFEEFKKHMQSHYGDDTHSRITAFLSLEEDERMSDTIYSLIEQNHIPFVDSLFYEFENMVRKAEQISAELSENNLTSGQIYQAILVRAKDLLKETANYLQTHADEKPDVKAEKVEQAILQLQQESKQEQIFSGLFRKILELLENKKQNSTDLTKYLPHQQKIVEQLQKEGGQELLLKVLSARGELRILPEIFWKVDRGNEDYQERFGFDVLKFLDQQKQSGEQQILVEFGHGSGHNKQERAEMGLDKYYLDVAVADKLYYNLRELIKAMIDWDAMAIEMGATQLKSTDKDLLVDLLYKTIVIADGQTNNETFSYAQDRINAINQNPNSLRQIMADILPQLAAVKTIPDQDDYCEIDENGQKTYPRRVEVAGKKCSPEFSKAKKIILAGKQFLKSTDEIPDVYSLVPAYPAGTMIGDFDQISSLKNNQIDIAIGTRSTVYKEGEDYKNFMENIFAKLKENGVYIDDNVRENFGVSNRIDQLQKIKNEWEGQSGESIDIEIIMGPGVAGEDFTEDPAGVPMAIIVSKGSKRTKAIKKLMQPGYYTVRLEDYGKQTLRLVD